MLEVRRALGRGGGRSAGGSAWIALTAAPPRAVVAPCPSGTLESTAVPLFQAPNTDTTNQNTWEGWYDGAAFCTVASGSGKHDAYNTMPLQGIRMEDDAGYFAEYTLTPAQGRTLLSIVLGCAGGTSAQHVPMPPPTTTEIVCSGPTGNEETSQLDLQTLNVPPGRAPDIHAVLLARTASAVPTAFPTLPTAILPRVLQRAPPMVPVLPMAQNLMERLAKTLLSIAVMQRQPL